MGKRFLVSVGEINPFDINLNNISGLRIPEPSLYAIIKTEKIKLKKHINNPDISDTLEVDLNYTDKAKKCVRVFSFSEEKFTNVSYQSFCKKYKTQKKLSN